MKQSEWLHKVFDNHFGRALGIVLVLALLYRMFFGLGYQGYDVAGQDFAKVTALRPIKSRYGGYRIIVVFKFEDGSTGSLQAPDIETLETGRTIAVEVLTKPGKRDRYRLAQSANQP